jgi:hypothetical protein
MFQTGFHYLLSVLTSFPVNIRDFFCAESPPEALRVLRRRDLFRR